LKRQTADLKWTSPDDLATSVVAAVSPLLASGHEATPPTAVQSIDVQAYSTRCHNRWAAVDLSAVAAPGALDSETERPPLAKVFIPQDCRRSRPPVSLPRDYLEEIGLDPDEEDRLLADTRQHWERQERLPTLELLSRTDAGRLVLLGDPGAGKSSLLRYVLLEMLDCGAAEGSAKWLRAIENHFPFLIELRDLVAREAEGQCQPHPDRWSRRSFFDRASTRNDRGDRRSANPISIRSGGRDVAGTRMAASVTGSPMDLPKCRRCVQPALMGQRRGGNHIRPGTRCGRRDWLRPRKRCSGTSGKLRSA
jgi:hypothetical protein